MAYRPITLAMAMGLTPAGNETGTGVVCVSRRPVAELATEPTAPGAEVAVRADGVTREGPAGDCPALPAREQDSHRSGR